MDLDKEAKELFLILVALLHSAFVAANQHCQWLQRQHQWWWLKEKTILDLSGGIVFFILFLLLLLVWNSSRDLEGDISEAGLVILPPLAVSPPQA